MPKIDKPERVTFSYSPDEIVQLIIQDLAEHHGINANAEDIQSRIVGGTMYDANVGYSGGGGPLWQCDPVKFLGYTGSGKTK